MLDVVRFSENLVGIVFCLCLKSGKLLSNRICRIVVRGRLRSSLDTAQKVSSVYGGCVG